MWLATNIKANKGKIVNVLKVEKSTQKYSYKQLEAFPFRYILVLPDDRKLRIDIPYLYCQGCLNMMRYINT